MTNLATIIVFTFAMLCILALIEKIRLFRLRKKYDTEWFNSIEQDSYYLKREAAIRRIVEDLKLKREV